MEKRGRMSATEREVEDLAAQASAQAAAQAATVTPFARVPAELKPEAATLWRSIVASRPANYFSAGDWPLLREYCHTIATLVPRLNILIEKEFDVKTLDARDKLVRQGAALARSLRICVSSRTRPDATSMRDSVRMVASLWT